MSMRGGSVSVECDWWRDSMPARLSGELTHDESVAFDVHLADCADCCAAIVSTERHQRSLRSRAVPGAAQLPRRISELAPVVRMQRVPATPQQRPVSSYKVRRGVSATVRALVASLGAVL